MRLVTATAFAFAGALSLATLHAQQQPPPAGGQRMGGMQMPDTARKVENGGIHAAGWQGKPDEGTGSINDGKFEMKGSEITINSGPAALYWNPANSGSGNYTVSATFTEPKYMSSMTHSHPYGVFIAGNNLDSAKATALYCAAYGRGTFIVRGFGPAAFQMNGQRGAPSDAVHKAAGPGESVTQTIAMSVKGDNVECAINGTTVATYPKSAVVGDGKLTSTDGIAGIRVAHNVDVVVKDFKVTK